ncbi:MAG TPA: VWA domain-containing protein [Methylomirabilota bacterium]|nr:VWA domain-containing protein [Methylomirabilota bacterium]
MAAVSVPARPLPSDLLTATVRFCRLLRARGLGITPAESRDALRTLELIDLTDRAEVHRALRTVLVTRPEEFSTFDAAFDAFWGGITSPASVTGPAGETQPPAIDAHFPRAPKTALEFADWTEFGEGEGEPVGLPGLSDIEAMLGKDFSSFAAEELEEIARLAAQLARRLATRKSRRLTPSRRRGRVDLRRTMRTSLTRGEPVELARRRRKILKTKLVVLCDVSGSMDLYSRLLVQFLYALQNQLGRMETFVFSTRLHRITDELRGQTYGSALARLGEVRDWSGGTKIGESLRAFLADWRHLLDRDTVVIVLSDGWDTGDPAILAETLLRMRRRAGKVIWLNPLLGSPDYQPLTQGMIAALPHVDVFLPAHNLESLRALARHLKP